MARERVLVDTGPLVALLADNDAEHERCVQESHKLSKPFLTTWPVLTEAAWLLRNSSDCIPKILGLIEQGLIDCVELDESAASAIASLARQYTDLRPQLADLSLVYIANKLKLPNIF